MQTIVATYKRSFYESTVLEIFSRMKAGRLTVSLPNGECLSFGHGREIQAGLQISHPNFFKRCVLYGDIGFGESYVEREWETDNLTNAVKWFLFNIEHTPGLSGSRTQNTMLNLLKAWNKLLHWKNANDLSGSKKNIAAHYDLNNDFFRLFLDPSMTYSSAYFKEEGLTLQQAQIEKYKRLCEQLKLKPADHVLEIGSGWGGNAIYIAKNYDCRVTSVTISEEQYKLARERVQQEGLTEKINIEMMDYRQINGTFDKIISIEMLEAVGEEFIDLYFKKCHSLLKKNGLLALQVITCPDSRYQSMRKGVDWIQKHIFPGSLLPSVGRINQAVNATGDLTLVDLKDLGTDYAKTLRLWKDRFNKNLFEIQQLGFDQSFIRKWNYYFSYCEAAFSMRNISVMQMVYTRPNNIYR